MNGESFWGYWENTPPEARPGGEYDPDHDAERYPDGPEPHPDGDFECGYECAGGCGYPVDHPGELCGECACEDDGDVL